MQFCPGIATFIEVLHPGKEVVLVVVGVVVVGAVRHGVIPIIKTQTINKAKFILKPTLKKQSKYKSIHKVG